ncbi:MAG: hypothetical protein LBR47_07940 [Spirochaetaceae bacterium]|jgi:hypothetical protein|nr:hypothetical protein [Spirochaetaceae bacterium]
MATVDKMSLFHTISALNETQFAVVWKMLQGLTTDVIKIETLSTEESQKYEPGFEEMKNGEYKTPEQIKSERNDP